MIEVLKNVLPKEINNKIILCLLDSSNWKIAKDLRNNQEVLLNDLLGESGKDSGFSVRTFDEKENIYIHSPLNLYAEIIYEIVKQHTKYKFLKPIRFNWNYYNNSSQATPHTDNDEGYYVSFVYNLNTNNGGTNINDEFYRSNVGEAILFPSNFTHNSVAQTDTKGRFNLNCVIELQRSIS